LSKGRLTLRATADPSPSGKVGWATSGSLSGLRGGRETAIKADQGDQLRLLDLQAVDTALAQLEHRRRTLPENAEIARLRAERGRLASDLVGADTAVSDLERDQSRAESELEPVKDRLSRNQHRIADGSIADPKALSSLIEEVQHLKRRIDTLEEAELEVMEQLESASEDRERLRREAAELDAQLAALEAKRDTQLRELAAELTDRRGVRDQIAPLIPANLLTLYDKIGASHAGVGAAELRRRRCTGCQLDINSADLRVFAAAPADEVLRCEECGRILVRTAESGL
jgi:predicted  nucleic acid-binding Zn-ribbon protein